MIQFRGNRFLLLVGLVPTLLLAATACNLPRSESDTPPPSDPDPTTFSPATTPTPTTRAEDAPSPTEIPDALPTPEIRGEPEIPAGSPFVDGTDDLLPTVVNVNYGIDFADVDADGSLDIWVADCGRLGDQLLLNDGGGRYADVTAASLSRPEAFDHWKRTSFGEDVAFADVDGDGDSDAYVNSRPHKADGSVWAEALFINDGTGHFVDEIHSRMPTDVFWQQGISGLAAFGDLDDDGDPDLIRTTRFHGTTGPDQDGRTGLFLNDGAGFFDDATERLPDDAGTHSSGLGLADVDLDGDLDIVMETSPVDGKPETANELHVYLNDGDGRFRDASDDLLPAAWREGLNAGKFALGDLDADGDVEIVSSNVILRYEEGLDRFVADHEPPIMDGAGLAIVGDVDGDGYPDIVATKFRQTGDEGAHDPVLRLNDQSGGLGPPQTIARMPAGTVIQEMGLADVDGDGDRDLYVGTGVPPHDHPGQEGMQGGTQLDRLFINTSIQRQASR